MFLIFTLISIFKKLEQWDRWLFILINEQLSNPFFDSIMPYLRNANFWLPLYLFLFLFVLMNVKKNSGWWLLLFICTISLTDILRSKIFKESFERLRPFQDPDFLVNVRLLVNHCSGGYSFTSSHAANHFGMATFFFITFHRLFKNWALLAFLWATAICYAQVYVGVHYPFDVLGGAVAGVFIGLITGGFFNKQFGIVTFGK